MRTAHETGRPIVRPLCLEWPEVAATYAVTNQFLVGRDLLVSARPAAGRVFLPKGRWYDWWTHRVVEGRDDWMVVPVPAGKGGHLFVREGAVIPTVQSADFIVPGKLDAVTWLVFPSEEETSFDLYHDDGLTRRWQHGDFAKQRVVQKSGKLTFGAVVGAARFLKNVKHEVKVLQSGR